jgi:hypothetical protein
MLGLWLQDLEALEAISQDETTRRICLRMSGMSQAGRLEAFVAQLAFDEELDEETKGTVAELASNPTFLLAVEDYLGRTQRVH